MKNDFSFSTQSIETEYLKLGHTLGWRLLTCPARNLTDASICLITLNPGGHECERPRWSVEDGSAYVVESWKNCVSGEEKLQRQVRRMFELMEVAPEDVLSGYLVPFRSPSWSKLPEKDASLAFGLRLWKDILEKSKTRILISLGKDISRHIVDLLAMSKPTRHRVDWGEQTIDVYSGDNRKLIVLPHLSRFSLFGRMKHPTSESVFRDIYSGALAHLGGPHSGGP